MTLLYQILIFSPPFIAYFIIAMILVLISYLMPKAKYIFYFVAISIFGSAIYIENIRTSKVSQSNDTKVEETNPHETSYVIDYHVFNIPNEYLPSSNSWYAPRAIKARSDNDMRFFDFDMSAADFSPYRKTNNEYRNNDNLLVRAHIRKRSNPGEQFEENLPFEFVKTSRSITENNWIFYKSNQYEYDASHLYFRNLNTDNPSKMICHYRDDKRKSPCIVYFNLNDEIEVSVYFSSTHEQNWELIENNVRSTIDEFYGGKLID